MTTATDATNVTTTDVPEAANPDDARLMAHSYDGIREYDNPLPGWWRAIFWGSIVFAAGYFIWFHVGHWGSTPGARYREALAEYDSLKERREAADAANVSEEMLARDAQDPKVLAHGAEIFKARCVPCHTEDGHGLIGPNLTDLTRSTARRGWTSTRRSEVASRERRCSRGESRWRRPTWSRSRRSRPRYAARTSPAARRHRATRSRRSQMSHGRLRQRVLPTLNQTAPATSCTRSSRTAGSCGTGASSATR